jgi:hypothetical protein
MRTRVLEMHTISPNLRTSYQLRFDLSRHGSDNRLDVRDSPLTSRNLSFARGIVMRQLLAIAVSSTLVLQVAALAAAPRPGGARTGSVQAPASTRTIQGTVQSAVGQTLPNHRVQVRDLRTGKVAATGTSNAGGAFSFAGLPPAAYAVEVVRATGEIVGCNAAMPAAANGNVNVTVSEAAVQTSAGAANRITTTKPVVTRAAVAAGIASMAAPAGRDIASPSR